jgi:hypothetical protein
MLRGFTMDDHNSLNFYFYVTTKLLSQCSLHLDSIFRAEYVFDKNGQD